VNTLFHRYKVGFFRPFYFLLFISVVLFSCSNEDHNEEPRFDYYPSKIEITYAKGFSVSYFKSYKIVDVYNDGDSTELIQRYYLVEQGTKAPEMESDAELIRVPLASVSCLSTTQIAYLSVLKQCNAISGVGHADFIKDSIIQEQVSKGWTIEITRGGQVDKELILQSNTSTLMANAFDELSVSSLSELGIPVIYSTEYLENNALARAEWIKFFALFFNAEKKASTYFTELEKKYNEIQEKIIEKNAEPGVMFGSYYQGTWFVPGGKSLIPSLFKDAGASYVYADQMSVDNVHIDPESLMQRMSQIDYWGFVLSKEAEPDLSDFLGGDQRMQDLAVKLDMNFFYCNSFYCDYFGMANLEPDVLLQDLGKIFHPSLFPDHQFVYFQSFK
jgi:iron complex transport system substrate-binding protein